MTDVVIHVENLSKLYRIGRAQRRHDTMRDAISDVGSRIGRIVDRGLRIANPAIRNPQFATRNP